jgi:PAS domain S-box-containing protein
MVTLPKVTKKFKAPEDLVLHGQLLASLINSKFHYVLRLNTKGFIRFVNSSFLDKFEYSEAALTGHHFTKIILFKDRELTEKVLNMCIANPGEIFPISQQTLDSKGNPFWTSWEFIGITNTEGTLTEIQGLGHDISEDQKIKEDLEANEINLNALINNTPDLIWSVDKDNLLISANNAFKDSIDYITGYYPRLGKRILSTGLSKDMVDKWKGYYGRALSGEDFSVIESPPVKNGEFKKVEISFNPIRNGNREPIGVSCFAHDITERVNFEDQILSQNKTLKEIASIASHDIRGPVASMLGLLSLLDKSTIKGEQNLEIFDYLEQAMKQLDSVIHIIVEKSAQIDP